MGLSRSRLFLFHEAGACGRAGAESHESLPPSRRQLGHGTQGVVILAKDMLQHRLVAIKQVSRRPQLEGQLASTRRAKELPSHVLSPALQCHTCAGGSPNNS